MSFYKKHKRPFLIAFVAIFLLQSIWNFYQFADKNDGMAMIAGIVFGVMAILYGFDLFDCIKNQKKEISN
ncbi:MAG: hypothetical protein WBP16_11805 [Ferruginibacter sp.]